MNFKLKEQFYFHLEELIEFNSVISFPLQNKPFGEQIDLCLDKVLEIAQDIGFEVYKACDGYYGFADIGKGDELIGILTHIDIVDAGNISNWHSDPFKLSFRNGKVYARGALDDKGPLMAVLYAFKLLISKGIFFNKRFRVIFGTDEETTWRCIEQYKIKEEIPSIAFTPDGYFPVVNAEKGLLQFDVISNEKFFMNFELVTGYNVISDECIFELGDSNKCDFRGLLDSFEGKIKYKFFENNVIIHGISAHASLPELGINVAPYALTIIESLVGIKANFINFFKDKISFTINGEKLFNEVLEDSISGKLTLCLTKIRLSKTSNNRILSFDMRYPVSYKREVLVDLIKKALNLYSLSYHEVSYLDSLYVDSSLNFVESLIEIYKNFTGDSDAVPISIDGATYARALNNCVAFGSLFKESDSTAHKINEYITENDLMNLIILYK